MGRINLGNIVFLDCADKSRIKTVVGHVTRSAGTRDGRAGAVRTRLGHNIIIIGDTLIEPHPQYLYPKTGHAPSSCNPFHTPTTPVAPLVTPSPPSSHVAMLTPTEETIADIKSATAGFDLIFSNELGKAESLFRDNDSDSALHLLGSGACAFLQAALSLEVRIRLCNHC